MTATSPHPGPAAPAPSTTTSPRTAKEPLPGPLKRLLRWFVPATVGLYCVWGAVPGILLPLQVGGVDASHKAGNLALVSTVGAFAAMIAQPVAGAISDRTRSRFGRRAPWIVGGALVGGLSLVALALANTVVTIAIAWTAVQIAYNFLQGPQSAIMPDRVPVSSRGTFSAVIGAATMVGGLGGAIVAAAFAHDVRAGYLVFAGVALIATTLLVVFNPDQSSLNAELTPFSLGAFLRGFWVSPRKHPDFGWAFLGRLLLYTGYFTVIGYQLYLLQDYIGVGDRAAQLVPLLGLASLPAILLSIGACGPLSDRTGRRKPFVFASSVLVGIGLLIPWAWPTVTGMVLCSVVSGLGFGAFQAVDTALMSQVLPSAESFAKDLGVVNIAATLPQTVAPAVAGAIVLSVGYAGLFPAAAVLSVLGALAVFPIKAVD